MGDVDPTPILEWFATTLIATAAILPLALLLM